MPVSVVVPFSGDELAALATLDVLARIERCTGDELIIADNSERQVVQSAAERWPEVRVVAATGQRSSYYARNVGSAVARNEWLLFIDSDCVPDPKILDRYFSIPISEDEGALAGEIVGDRSTVHVVARYQFDRGYLSQRRNVEDQRPYAVTANLLVRASAWRSVGGFLEGIRSAGDTDFTWRLQDAGWRLGYRPDARVVHSHRETFGSFARVILRYGAGRAWLNRRYPGAAPRAPAASSAVRALGAGVRWMLAGDVDRASFRLVDAAVILLDRPSRFFRNASRQPQPSGSPRAGTDVVVLTDTFPERSETFIGSELRGLMRAGLGVRVEAARRASRQDLAASREFVVNYREDDPPHYKVMSLIAMVVHHPAACMIDLLARRRWSREEPVPPLRIIAPAAQRLRKDGTAHLHAHFASGAALTAMRISRLTGCSYSVTAHAYDIFREPRNLREKLERAAFVTTVCDYNIKHLRKVAPRAHLHKLAMGVDPDKFRRFTPHRPGRCVVAVGRLVEKKGFAHLIDAVAELERSAAIERLEIVGDGPLRAQLEAQIERLGLGAVIRLRGALDPDGVRGAVEAADVFTMPSVVATDGDRDAMPVAAEEALALEVPVVASDEVGLPELVKPGWGRLVPPGDPQALAGAIAEVLVLGADDRARMGRDGRAHVLAHYNADRQSARLAELIAAQRTSIRSRTEARTAAVTSTTSSSG